ncbi:10477_t:CDS:2, partial [Dentiscutata heterogama]
TIKKLKEELKSRNISYEERIDRDKLVELLQEYMYKETLTKPLNDDVIVEEIELDSNPIQQFSFNTGWAFKHKHKYVRKGGQEDPSNQYLAKDMLAALEEIVENGELTKEEIPTEKSIDSWISRYFQISKQMTAKKILDDNIDCK